MILTNENYFSAEAEQMYMGTTQFKRFMTCEAQALAMLHGEWQEEKSTALQVGSYVDAHFSGTLDIFKAQNPEIFTRNGELKADYRYAEYIIERIERDEIFMQYISGNSQTIMTGEIEGVPVKIKVDSLIPNERIVDLKIMKGFDDVWSGEDGYRPFIEAWGYDIQAAIYQEVERQNRGKDAHPLPFGIAAATKEKPEPDIGLFDIPQYRIDSAMEIVRANIQHFDSLKKGLYEPVRCEKCAWCRHTKVLTGFKDYMKMA